VSPSSRQKLKTAAKLARLRQLWAWEGKTVVFTNGVFDILHAGHVDILEKCRALGDILIVGLNEDKSVRMLEKGPGRPINRFADRARVLAALSCVDVVIGFGEQTPEKLIARVKPDVLVKGADYKKSQVAGAAHAKKVVLLPLKKGYSTTGLIKRLQGLS
jgi:D-beta-D-heptose 7-phosphate kinase / D-beta-D-heptose 1-phosphate adenosyltransferase